MEPAVKDMFKPLYVVALLVVPFLVVGTAAFALAGPLFGTFEVDVVRVTATQPVQKPAKPVPGVWIDTNVEIEGLLSGTVKSSLPYAAAIDFTDEKPQFEAVEFTRIEVLYDDGKTDPNAKPPKLPLRIAGQEYEAVNSVAGGKVVRTKLWLLSGRIPGVVTRDEPFTLRIEGHFVEEDGSKRPFAFDQHYDVEREKAVTPALELYKGV